MCSAYKLKWHHNAVTCMKIISVRVNISENGCGTCWYCLDKYWSPPTGAKKLGMPEVCCPSPHQGCGNSDGIPAMVGYYCIFVFSLPARFKPQNNALHEMTFTTVGQQITRLFLPNNFINTNNQCFQTWLNNLKQCMNFKGFSAPTISLHMGNHFWTT